MAERKPVREKTRFRKGVRGILTRRLLFCAAVFLLLAAGSAYYLYDAPSALGSITIVEHNSTQLTAKTDTAHIDISFPSERCVKIRVVQDGRESAPTQAIEGALPRSVPFSVKTSLGRVTASTSALELRVNKKNGKIEIFDRAGTRIIAQSFEEKIEKKRFAFTTPKGAPLYGVRGFAAGEPSHTLMTRKGALPISAGKQGSCGAPLIWSGGFALFADTDGGSFDAADGCVTLSGTSRADLEYFVIAGSPYEIMKEVHLITGGAPLFPKWSSGFINSEWGIDQRELLEHVDTYRRKNIPLDCFILDFDWKAWGEDRYGEWRWNADNFPDGESGRLAKNLAVKGITLGGILKPRIHVNTEQGRYALQRNFFWPGKPAYSDYFSQDPVNDLNFAVPGCRVWFWQKLIPAYDTGIRAFWSDEADEGFDNRQFMYMQRALFEGQRSLDDRRVWSINRNFYSGSQRYAYALWSGDIQSTWKAMKEQRERMLSAVNLGMMRWSMDTGGFNGTPEPENYARWMQFAAFCPIMRVHGSMDVQRQPWFYGEKAEKAAADAIRLRYSLLPYIYSYEKQYHDLGVYLVRPLFWENTKSSAFENYIDGWYFGEHLAVFPVVDKGTATKEVLLPEGEWYGYFDGKKYAGGKHTLVCDTENWSDIPLFIKSGAIIPGAEPANSTAFASYNTIYVDVFPSEKKSSFTYYDDDGITYRSDSGEFFRQTITAQRTKKGTYIELTQKDGRFKSALTHYIFRIYRCGGTPAGMEKVSSIEALQKKDEGFCIAKSGRGEYTAVKIRAGKARSFTLE